MSTGDPYHHNTYLHAGAGSRGWPHDHSVEDTYECPPWEAKHIFTIPELPKLNAQVEGSCAPEGVQHDLSELKARSAFFTRIATSDTPQYTAESDGKGGAILVLYTPAKIIARFDTYADATTAAQALNNHKGY